MKLISELTPEEQKSIKDILRTKRIAVKDTGDNKTVGRVILKRKKESEMQ